MTTVGEAAEATAQVSTCIATIQDTILVMITTYIEDIYQNQASITYDEGLMSPVTVAGTSS